MVSTLSSLLAIFMLIPLDSYLGVLVFYLCPPVIKANGRMAFEDELRSAILHYTVN